MGRWVPVPVAPPPAAAVPFAAARPTVVYFLFSLVAVLASLLAAGRRLSREAEPQAGLFDRWKGSRRWLRTLPGTGNPMVWKESRLLNTAASRPLYYALLGLLLAGELAFLVFATTDGMSGWDIVQTALAIAAAHACLLGLVAAVAGAASMAHERSTGTLDLLRVSLLTPAEVFRGKVAGAVRALGLLALFPVLHLLLCAATGFLHPLVAAAALVLLAATLLFWLGVGFACGALLFRSGRAVSLAAGIFGAALVGVPLLAVLLDEGAGMHDASEFLAGLWPPGTVYYFLEAAARAFPGDYSSWYWYGRVVRHTGATVVAASLLLAAPAALLVARRLLARRLHREGESG